MNYIDSTTSVPYSFDIELQGGLLNPEAVSLLVANQFNVGCLLERDASSERNPSSGWLTAIMGCAIGGAFLMSGGTSLVSENLSRSINYGVINVDKVISQAGHAMAMRKLVGNVQNRVEEVSLDVVNKIKAFSQVTAIYSQKHRLETQYIVFLNTASYDNKLMHSILDVEYDLQQEYGDQFLKFSYIQGVYHDRRKIVHPQASLIYARE